MDTRILSKEEKLYIFIEILNDKPNDYKAEVFFKLHLKRLLPFINSREIENYCSGLQNIINKVPLPKDLSCKMSDKEIQDFERVKSIALHELENMLKIDSDASWIEAIKSYYMK